MALLGLFALVMAAVTAAGYWFLRRAELAEIAGTGTSVDEVASALRWLGEKTGSKAAKAESLGKRLAGAGFKRPEAPSIFRGIQFACAAGAAVLGTGAALAAGNSAPELAAICGAGVGYLGPDRVLNILVVRRRQKLRSGLLAAIDLMLLSVEAGQSLDVALLETARGLLKIFPELSAEFQQMLIDLRAGTSRSDAFHSLADRTNEPEIKKLVGLLIDTDRFGTPLGPALRTHATYLQRRFRQHAQEKARKVGVKLVFPVFFLIFPSVILVTLGPAAIMVMTQLDKYMSM